MQRATAITAVKTTRTITMSNRRLGIYKNTAKNRTIKRSQKSQSWNNTNKSNNNNADNRDSVVNSGNNNNNNCNDYIKLRVYVIGKFLLFLL